MSFTYHDNPKGRTEDAVRFELGDTQEDNYLISDAEIEYALDAESDNVLLAAARLAEGLAARFARRENVRYSGFTTEHGSLQAHFNKLAKDLRQRVATSSDFIIINMLSVTQHKANRDDNSIVQPAFRRGLFSREKATYDSSVGVVDDVEEES